ncbi:MAG: hypothetical protein OFPI_38330 [Osedax symbiont Rs2]|nr:MAG: hypothetical protein OFPI_38330 [Osedax symbiont Rs2]
MTGIENLSNHQLSDSASLLLQCVAKEFSSDWQGTSYTAEKSSATEQLTLRAIYNIDAPHSHCCCSKIWSKSKLLLKSCNCAFVSIKTTGEFNANYAKYSL